MTDRSRRYRKPEGILHAQIDDEEVLLNPDTGMYHLVNRTGRFLLDRMEEGDTLGDAIQALSDDAGEDLGRVGEDATSFVSAMTSRGLLVPADD